VELEVLYKETEELRNHFLFASIGGKGPDMIYGPADNVGMLAITETIRPLDTLLTPEAQAAFIDEGLLRYDGRIYGVADQIGNHLTLVYNKDLVDEPPATFDELLEVARANTLDTDGDGSKERYGLVWNYTEPFFFIPFLTAFDGWVMNEDEEPTLDNAATVAAIDFIKGLRDEEQVIPPTVDYNTAETLFKEGRAAMIINGPWAWAGYGESGIDYGLAPIPYNETAGEWARPMAAAKGYSVNPAVADWKLPTVLGVLGLLTGDEIQEQMTRELATIPVRTAVRASGAMEANPIVAQSLAQLERSRPMPTSPTLRQIWDGMRGPYQLVMNGEVTGEEGARQMQAEVEKRLADFALRDL
jgi:maltose-binding protein MalE